MRRCWWMVGLALLLATSAVAQDEVQGNLTATTCTASTQAAGCVPLTLAGRAGVAFQVQGTYSGTITFEGTVDGSTWVALYVTSLTSTTPASTTTTTGVFVAGVGGLQAVRARMSSYTSGTAAVNIRRASASANRGGGGSLTGTDTDVCFADGTAAVCNDADFTWDKTNNRLTLVGALSADGTMQLGEVRSGVTSVENANNGLTNMGKTNSYAVFGASSVGNSHAYITAAQMGARSGFLYGWTSNATDPYSVAALDTGLARAAAGVVEANNGTAGTFATYLGHFRAGAGTTLTVANVGANSCGTSAASVAGNQNAFAVTVGATSGTQCRVTLPTAATRWHCVSTDETTTIATRAVAVDTTHVDLLGAFVAGDVVTAICLER